MTRNTGAIERGIRHILFGAILLGAGAVLSACATTPYADAYTYEDDEDYEDYEYGYAGDEDYDDYDDDEDYDYDDEDYGDWEEEDAEAYLKYPG